MIYARITHNLDEDARVEVDAILGDPDAQRRRNEMRRAAVEAMGIEIA